MCRNDCQDIRGATWGYKHAKYGFISRPHPTLVSLLLEERTYILPGPQGDTRWRGGSLPSAAHLATLFHGAPLRRLGGLVLWLACIYREGNRMVENSRSWPSTTWLRARKPQIWAQVRWGRNLCPSSRGNENSWTLHIRVPELGMAARGMIFSISWSVFCCWFTQQEFLKLLLYFCTCHCPWNTRGQKQKLT